MIDIPIWIIFMVFTETILRLSTYGELGIEAQAIEALKHSYLISEKPDAPR